MTERVHVEMTVDLFIDDQGALRESVFETMRKAWNAEEDFPYESAQDVPLATAIHSALAAALPLEFSGCRRGRLDAETSEPRRVSEGDDDAGSGADRDDPPSGDRSDEDATADRPADDDAGSGADRDDDATGQRSSADEGQTEAEQPDAKS